MATPFARPLPARSVAAAEFPLGQELAPIAPADFSRLRMLIEERCGIQLPESKRPMVEARLRKRLLQLGLSSFNDYWRLLFDPARQSSELVPLTDALTTNKTDFLREPNHFAILEKSVLPALYAAGIGRRTPLRVWSAGCSTGEEPYTIAMCLSETLGDAPWEVLATDLDTQVIATAREGVYPLASVMSLPQERRHRFFQRGTGRFEGKARVRQALGARVEFTRLNLMDAEWPVAPGLDAVFCRNVMIYFDKSTQRGLVERYAALLQPQGLFFAGHAESLLDQGRHFRLRGQTVYERTQ